MAAFQRQKKLPSLKSLMRSTTKRAAQSPEQVRAAVLSWAQSQGLTITRHEKPVM